MPAFTLRDTFGRRTETGGRFRLDHHSLKDRGTWSWQQNPFVNGDRRQRWFVVRDLGIGLGDTVGAQRGDIDAFEEHASSPAPKTAS